MKHHQYVQKNVEKHRNICSIYIYGTAQICVCVYVCIYIYWFAVFILFRAVYILKLLISIVFVIKQKKKSHISYLSLIKSVSCYNNFRYNETILYLYDNICIMRIQCFIQCEVRRLDLPFHVVYYVFTHPKEKTLTRRNEWYFAISHRR